MPEWTIYDERDFQRLVEDSNWVLTDDGTLGTSLECVTCGYEEHFLTRDDVLIFLMNEDGTCDRCEERERMGQV